MRDVVLEAGSAAQAETAGRDRVMKLLALLGREVEGGDGELAQEGGGEAFVPGVEQAIDGGGVTRDASGVVGAGEGALRRRRWAMCAGMAS